MRDLAGARTNFNGADPPIFLEVRRDGWNRKDIRTGRRNLHLRQLDDVIGLAQLPAIGEHRQRRHVLQIALRRTLVHPFRDRRDFCVGQPRIVLEHADARLGHPGRHLPRYDLVLDRSRPRPGILVGQQRHRRDLAGAVARDAARVQNWRDVVSKGRLIGRRGDAVSSHRHVTHNHQHRQRHKALHDGSKLARLSI